MKNRRVSAGEVLTVELLKQLNSEAWNPTMTKGQLIVVKEGSPSFADMTLRAVVSIPANGLKNWTHEKFIAKFKKTMNASYYDIMFT